MGYETATPGSGRTGQEARERASETMGKARESAGEVATTAKEQARGVVDESRAQLQNVTAEMRERLGAETRTQTQRASEALRHWSDDLASMADRAETDSPVRGVVSRVAQSGRGAADFLDERGVEGMAEEVRAFARRRPGMFLAGAALAGFAVGRLAKAVTQESRREPDALAAPSGGEPLAAGTPRPREEGTAVPGVPLSPEAGEAPRYGVPPHDSPYDRPRYQEGS